MAEQSEIKSAPLRFAYPQELRIPSLRRSLVLPIFFCTQRLSTCPSKDEAGFDLFRTQSGAYDNLKLDCKSNKARFLLPAKCPART
jgi:hypothetical protein